MKPLRIYKASAGSGKTFTLAVEYIALLAINPSEYQHILAVTFTNKATAEMKKRILSTLYAIAHGLEDAKDYVKNILENLVARQEMPQYQEEPYRSILQGMNEETLRKRAQEALSNIIHDYSRFHIETIDSFFQGIVHELANELELPSKMKVELDESEVLENAVSQIIENLHEGSSELHTIIDFIEEKIRENRSWKVGETVKEFGRNIFKENYLIHGEEVRQKITDANAIHRYRRLINTGLAEKKQAMIEMAQKMIDQYERCGMNEKDCTTSIVKFLQKVCNDEVKEALGTAKGTFSDAIQAHITDVNKWFKKSSKQQDILRPDVEHILMPMLQQLFDLHDAYASHLHTVNAISQHLYSLMLLNEISQTVKSLNEKGNQFLLSETANFLRNVINNQDIPFIYEKTGATIKHIMIDEFQDTSTLQWGNFKPLIMNSLATDGSCLIVGDVKQSIYRFRNSDWQILNNLEHDSELKNYMSKIPAEFNFRSSRHVVQFNNDLFKNAIKLLQVECPALSTAYGDVEQTPKKNQEAGFVKIENIDYHDIDKEHQPTEWDKKTSENYDEATLQRLQLSVKDLIENHVDANDITILVRTNKEVPQICDYFNAHQDVLQVKVVSDDAFRLDASPAVNMIICALRLLADPDNALHLAAITHHIHAIPSTFDEQARKLLRFKPLTEMVEDIYQIFQLNQLSDQDAYLFYLNDLVAQFCEERQADLDSFLEAWDEGLCEKTIPGGTADGVRIMTMHKSKGLEFHSVIIPSCSWAIKPKGDNVMWCIPQEAPYNQMPLLPISVSRAKDDSIFAENRREEELRTLVDNINVLYVAFTRAKHNLIILTGNKLAKDTDTATPPQQMDSAQTFLIKAMPVWMQQTDVEGCITVYQYGAIVPTDTTEKIQKKQQEVNIMNQEYAPLPVTFTSYPSVAAFQQSYDSDMFITADSLNPKIQQHAHRIQLISLGNLYHSIFQHIHTIDDVPHTIRLLASKGCFGTLLDAKEAEKAVTRMIKDISVSHPEWFSPEWKTLNERAILFLENKTFTTQRPDRVIVNGTKAIIIDYKTAKGAVKTLPDGTLVPPSENKMQVEGYKNLLTQIGYTNIEGYLWYILDQVILKV
ncbi:MAG: UvrD-helicase domain-containing protein [Bacteroidaceae bacterium]|nr:UvrD-helicase domain-containing protein [Bacteroidaceae bacterium]